MSLPKTNYIIRPSVSMYVLFLVNTILTSTDMPLPKQQSSKNSCDTAHDIMIKCPVCRVNINIEDIGKKSIRMSLH